MFFAFIGNVDIFNNESKEPKEFINMIDNIDAGDVVKISKISVLGPGVSGIVEKYQMIRTGH